MHSVTLDAMAAWAFLQRSVPSVAMAAASARWRGGVLGSLLESSDVVATVQSMLPDLDAAWRATFAAPRAVTIAPLPRSASRTARSERPASTEWLGPGMHPKDALRCQSGAVRFASQTARHGGYLESSIAEREATRPRLDVRYGLVEANSTRGADFSRAQGRMPAAAEVRCGDRRIKQTRGVGSPCESCSIRSLERSVKIHAQVCAVEGAESVNHLPALLDSAACALTLPRTVRAPQFDPPLHAPPPGANPEALEPAPPRLPDPRSDAVLRPRLRVPDMSKQAPRAALTTDAAEPHDPEAATRGPGQFEPPRWLALCGGAGRTADFARGTGHGISLDETEATGGDAPEGAVLDLDPSFALVRRAPRAAQIAGEARTQRRAPPGAAEAEAARQEALRMMELQRPARLRLDAILPRPRSAPDMRRVTARPRSATAEEGGASGALGADVPGHAVAQHPPAPAAGAFVSFARQTGRSRCGGRLTLHGQRLCCCVSPARTT